MASLRIHAQALRPDHPIHRHPQQGIQPAPQRPRI